MISASDLDSLFSNDAVSRLDGGELVQRGANPGNPVRHLVIGVKEGNSKFNVFAPGRGEDIADQSFKRILSGHRRSRKSDDKL